MIEAESLSPQRQLVDSLRQQQQDAWKRGKQLFVEAILSACGDESLGEESLLELIYSEVVLREEHGDDVGEEEYLGRFPHLAERIRKLFEVHRAMLDSQIARGDTSRSRGSVNADRFESTVINRESDPRLATTITRTAEVTSRVAHGEPFGDYVIAGEIARGGMGVVYRARHAKLNRSVALKMILSATLASEDSVKRFYAEAEAAARLEHSGIVPIYEIGKIGDQHFYAMAFVEGGSLAQRVKIGPLPPDEAAKIVQKIAEAVQFAHDHGVIHRDLKPGNILLDQDGQPKVTDFGLAKMLDQDSGLSATGDVMGSPSYMSPEQAAGKIHEVGPLADVYSLGAILYCLLTVRGCCRLGTRSSNGTCARIGRPSQRPNGRANGLRFIPMAREWYAPKESTSRWDCRPTARRGRHGALACAATDWPLVRRAVSLR